MKYARNFLRAQVPRLSNYRTAAGGEEGGEGGGTGRKEKGKLEGCVCVYLWPTPKPSSKGLASDAHLLRCSSDVLSYNSLFSFLLFHSYLQWSRIETLNRPCPSSNWNMALKLMVSESSKFVKLFNYWKGSSSALLKAFTCWIVVAKCPRVYSFLSL